MRRGRLFCLSHLTIFIFMRTYSVTAFFSLSADFIINLPINVKLSCRSLRDVMRPPEISAGRLTK